MTTDEVRERNEKWIAMLNPIIDELTAFRESTVTPKAEAAPIGNDGWRMVGMDHVLDPRKYTKEQHLVWCRLKSAVSYLETDVTRTQSRERQRKVEEAKKRIADMERAEQAG